MPPPATHFYNPTNTDRIAVISVQESWGNKDQFLIQVARGPKSGKLSNSTAYGPYPTGELADRLAEVSRILQAQGYLQSGVHAALHALQSSKAKVRARAARLLGLKSCKDYVEVLIARVPQATDDTCSIMDALGRMGDARAIPVLREQATRKLLSRRRSAVEALRNLGDAEGLAAARQRTLEQLGPKVRDALNSADESPQKAVESAANLALALNGSDKMFLGLYADFLYEWGTPVAVGAAVTALGHAPFEQAFIWRYAKSVLKRSMLRSDFATFGWLSHTIEYHGRTATSTLANVKSGYDGVQRSIRIFGFGTRSYIRRLCWRYLREIARYRPDLYSRSAAEVLIHYSQADADHPMGKFGAFARCYLLNQILYGASLRLKIDGRNLRTKLRSSAAAAAPSSVREERFPQLWDAQPRAYLRVLGAAKLAEVQAFAYQAITQRHRAVLQTASLNELLPLLHVEYEKTAELVLEELSRRFDPAKPDWALLERLCHVQHPAVLGLAQKWLRETAPLWCTDVTRIVAFLGVENSLARLLAAELVIAHAPDEHSFRLELSDRVLAKLRAPESSPQWHEAYAKVGRELLLTQIDKLLSLDEILTLLTSESIAVLSVASALLALHPEAAERIGLEKLTLFAQHNLAAVRQAAHAMIRAAEKLWAKDPSVLLVLAESDWPDTRAISFELIRTRLAGSDVGYNGLIGMIDSNRVDVQNMGIELARKHLERYDVSDLISRLIQHPHPNVRKYALQLIERHLPPGAEALEKLKGFCRTGIFDYYPHRALKQGIIRLLGRRGTEDAKQAEVASSILTEFLHLKGRADFEEVLEALVRIKLAHPQAVPSVTLPQTEASHAG